jgi:hypothetical protein
MLDKVIELHKPEYDKMEQKVPYITGDLTEYHFVKMEEFVDYMTAVDANVD